MSGWTAGWTTWPLLFPTENKFEPTRFYKNYSEFGEPGLKSGLKSQIQTRFETRFKTWCVKPGLKSGLSNRN